MSARYFALRAVIGSAIAVAFFLTVGFRSLPQTFAIAVVVSLASHAVVLGVQRRHMWLGIGCAAVALAATAFVIMDARSPVGPLRLVTVGDASVGARVKVHGYLEQGSLQRAGDAVRFVLHERGKRLQVELRAPAPDLLQERAEVVATGRVVRERGEVLLVAEEVMAKCPSTYNTKDGPRPATEFR